MTQRWVALGFDGIFVRTRIYPLVFSPINLWLETPELLLAELTGRDPIDSKVVIERVVDIYFKHAWLTVKGAPR